MTDKLEVRMMDNLVKMHQRNCNMFMIAGFTCVAVIGMNISLWVMNHNLSTISAICTGSLIFSALYNYVMWQMERLDLRLEKERRSFYKRIDIDEQKHLRDMGAFMFREEKDLK